MRHRVEADPTAGGVSHQVLGCIYHSISYPIAEDALDPGNHPDTRLSSSDDENPIVERKVEARVSNCKAWAVEPDLVCDETYGIRGSDCSFHRCESMSSKRQSMDQVRLRILTGPRYSLEAQLLEIEEYFQPRS